MSTAAKVAFEKQVRPERFCPFPQCLWRTMRLNHTTGIYFRSVIPVVGETDERLLKALVNLAESCMRNLALFFPELREIADELEKRGGQ